MARLNLVFSDLIFFLESDEVVHLSLWFPLVRLSLLRSVRVVWQPLGGGRRRGSKCNPSLLSLLFSAFVDNNVESFLFVRPRSSRAIIRQRYPFLRPRFVVPVRRESFVSLFSEDDHYFP